MTPKEKAKELYNKFDFEKFNGNDDFTFTDGYDYEIKQCALICVDEYLLFHDSLFYMAKESLAYKYWEDVKKEIELL